jgi:hypothetical protein
MSDATDSERDDPGASERVDEDDVERVAYVDRLIRHRCPEIEPGEMIHATLFAAVIEALAALSDRIEEIEARTSAYGPQPSDAELEARGPLQ